jgi:hypothetical protein
MCLFLFTYLFTYFTHKSVPTQHQVHLQHIIPTGLLSCFSVDTITLLLLLHVECKTKLKGRAMAQAANPWPLSAEVKFSPRSFHVGFVVGKVAMGQIFLQVLQLSHQYHYQHSKLIHSSTIEATQS